jgi:hypothetical protein
MAAASGAFDVRGTLRAFHQVMPHRTISKAVWIQVLVYDSPKRWLIIHPRSPKDGDRRWFVFKCTQPQITIPKQSGCIKKVRYQSEWEQMTWNWLLICQTRRDAERSPPIWANKKQSSVHFMSLGFRSANHVWAIPQSPWATDKYPRWPKVSGELKLIWLGKISGPLLDSDGNTQLLIATVNHPAKA